MTRETLYQYLTDMPRRWTLSTSELHTLLTLPKSHDNLHRYYSFNEADLWLIRLRRGDANRLEFALQLCLLRYRASLRTNGATPRWWPLCWKAPRG